MFRRLPLGLALLLHGLVFAAETRDLILVAGQSNAVGYDAYAEELPADPQDAATMFWWRVGDPPPDEFDGTSARQWTTLQFQPRTPAKPAADGKKVARQYGNFNLKTKGGFGPEIGMVRTLATKESRPLAVIKTAFSGTSVAADWNVGLPGQADACYRAMIDEAKAAIASAKSKDVTLRPRAFVWVQGESDANAKMPKVIAAQQAVAAALPRARYVDTAGAETLPPSHTHFTAAGTLEIGRRYAEALLSFESAK